MRARKSWYAFDLFLAVHEEIIEEENRMTRNVSGVEIRQVEYREHVGKPAVAVIVGRHFNTTADDLWAAITTPERLVRWFLPVEGDLKLGGRYQLVGNASGTIIHCDPPQVLDLTWEFGGAISWVNIRLTADGHRTQFTLAHISHCDETTGDEHFRQFGPGAAGVGWELGLHGLGQHFADPTTALDPAAFEAWTTSSDGHAFIRTSGEAWAAAHIASGENPAEARAKAERTIAFYTGTGADANAD